jgi:hypothetical protein
VLSDGTLCATWRAVGEALVVDPIRPLGGAETAAVLAEGSRLARFLGLETASMRD